MGRLAARTDNTQVAIVSALRQAGCLVLDLHREGHGCPDLLAWSPVAGQLLLLEVKSPGGTLTADEREFGLVWPVCVVRDPEQALRAVGLDVIRAIPAQSDAITEQLEAER